jgi:hypothetical protein
MIHLPIDTHSHTQKHPTTSKQQAVSMWHVIIIFYGYSPVGSIHYYIEKFLHYYIKVRFLSFPSPLFILSFPFGLFGCSAVLNDRFYILRPASSFSSSFSDVVSKDSVVGLCPVSSSSSSSTRRCHH